MPSPSLLFERWTIAVCVVATSALFLPAAADPVNVVKLTVLVLAAVAVVASFIWSTIKHRLLLVPVSAATAVAAALLVALGLSAAAGPVTTTAVLGTYGRNSGLLAYTCATILFLVALRTGVRGRGGPVAGAVVVAGAFTASYGLLQRLGVDAIAWNNPFNPILAALGNPNFAAAYMGVAASVAAGVALCGSLPPAFRAASAASAALCLLVAALSSSVQGPIAAAAGLSVVALAAVLEQRGLRRRVAVGALGAAVVGGVAVLLLGAFARTGPATPFFNGISYDARSYYWGAATRMLREHPLLGVGLDQYGGYWRTARSDQAVAQLGGGSYTDSAHSVPLQMFAQGGIVLGLLYLALIVVTGVALVRGIAGLQGAERMMLAALGGGWAAYQVQSLVSIDQVPLIVLHFVLAGSVVAAAGRAGVREVRLPGALPPPPPPSGARTRRRAPVAMPRERALAPRDLVGAGLLGLVALFAAWQALVPLRADIALRSADLALLEGRGNDALAGYEKATDLLPGHPYYWVKQAELYAKVQRPQAAQATYLQAVRRDERDPNSRRAAARFLETNGLVDQARDLYEESLRLDPLGTETIAEVANFELRHAGARRARMLLEDKLGELEKLARRADYALLWAALGDARAVLDDPRAAHEAYDVALFLQPGLEAAQQGVRKLEAAA